MRPLIGPMRGSVRLVLRNLACMKWEWQSFCAPGRRLSTCHPRSAQPESSSSFSSPLPTHRVLRTDVHASLISPAGRRARCWSFRPAWAPRTMPPPERPRCRRCSSPWRAGPWPGRRPSGCSSSRRRSPGSKARQRHHHRPRASLRRRQPGEKQQHQQKQSLQPAVLLAPGQNQSSWGPWVGSHQSLAAGLGFRGMLHSVFQRTSSWHSPGQETPCS